MRQWMVNPRILCKKHILGEHVEHHMFLGSLKKKIKMDGYLNNNLLEPMALLSRHEELARELTRRKINHKSPLHFDLEILEYLGARKWTKIDRDISKQDLLNRCPLCLQRYNFLIEKGLITHVEFS